MQHVLVGEEVVILENHGGMLPQLENLLIRVILGVHCDIVDGNLALVRHLQVVHAPQKGGFAGSGPPFQYKGPVSPVGIIYIVKTTVKAGSGRCSHKKHRT